MTMLWAICSALSGCAWLVGLEELHELPPDFPLPIEQAGKITAPPGGKTVSVDSVHETEALARARFAAMREAAEGQGFVVAERGREGKRDKVVLEGQEGRLVLRCCSARADKQWLVFVTWIPPTGRIE